MKTGTIILRNQVAGGRRQIFECKTSPLKSVSGIVKVPTGAGSGIDIDPEYIRKFQIVKG